MRVLLGFVIAAIYLTPLPAPRAGARWQCHQGDFFNGQPFIASSTDAPALHHGVHAGRQGDARAVGKAGEKVDGKWKVVKEGFCTQWKDGPTTCYRLVPSTVAEGKWAVMKGATTVANWAKQQP